MLYLWSMGIYGDYEPSYGGLATGPMLAGSETSPQLLEQLFERLTGGIGVGESAGGKFLDW